MAERRIIETFNTHRMTAEVVRAVATGRDVELEQILTAIRRAAAEPAQPPQPLIVYGERGSGKSFLMRMVELDAASLEDVACVLLPEEQYNIRTSAQILEAVTAKVHGRDWAWRLDPRPPAEAWDAAVAELHAALDARFGPGQGIAVVLIENFDTLARNLFGAESAKKKPRSAQAVEQRLAEERLRTLLNDQRGRFMLVATATGTVDLDYERPLFQAFQPIDLSNWSADTSITYFNRRRKLEGAPPLSAAEEGRARAITEFTAGNPRLAQLLGNVLSSPNARGIADTLDQLADHLADYYRRRLDDLSPTAAGLLDALVRGGEPASQSALAERVAGQQHQIADAFSYLTRSRLVAAARERGGASQLYRVRDRLFVHFYRRRYDASRSRGLAPIAELLERFYTPQERQVRIREHLERGEFEDARAYGGLTPGGGDVGQGYCPYRDDLLEGAAPALFTFAGVRPEEIEAVRGELREHPDQAFKKWSDRAQVASARLARTAALLLKARAASRCNLDPTAREILEEAVHDAKDETTDALILAQSEFGVFAWNRLRDRPLALSLLGNMRELSPKASTAYARGLAQCCTGVAAFHARQYEESLRANAEAMATCDEPEILVWALEGQVHAHHALGHAAEALSSAERLVSAAREHGDRYRLCVALNLCAWQLRAAERHDDALIAANEALELARRINTLEEETFALLQLASSQWQLKQTDAARRTFDEVIDVATTREQWTRVAEAARLKSWMLGDDLGAWPQAVQAATLAVSAAERARDASLLNPAYSALWHAAAHIATAGVADGFARALDVDTAPGDRPSLHDVVTATARNHEWAALLQVLQGREAVLGAGFHWLVFNGVGKVWAEEAAAQGRAATFGAIASELGVIDSLMGILPLTWEMTPDERKARHLADLTSGLLRACSDPGLLRDLADLFVQVFGEAAQDHAQRMRRFAEVHEADDKERVLQHFDPDLATAIRRMWELPEPKDEVALRARRKGR